MKTVPVRTFAQAIEHQTTSSLANLTSLANDAAQILSDQIAARAEAVDKGATLLAGGTRDGAIVPPTVLENVPPDATIHYEEVFGPAVNLYPVDDLDEALEVMNIPLEPPEQAARSKAAMAAMAALSDSR